MKTSRFLALLAAASLVLLSSVPVPVHGADIRVTLGQNPDGSFRDNFPCLDTAGKTDCLPPNPLALTVGAIPNQNILSGTSYAANLCGLYVTGTNASIAQCSIINCSLPTGWTATTAVYASFSLAYSGTGTGAASTCQLHVAAAGEQGNSNVFLVSATAPGGTDTLAPTIPVDLQVTPGANSLDWSWNPSTDNHDGTNNGSGVKEYDLVIDGGAPVVVSDAAGTIGPSTQYIVGAPSGTCSTSDSTGTVSITCAGKGVDTSPSEFGARGKSVSGDFVAVLNVATTTNNGNTNAMNGLYAAQTMSATEPFESFFQFSGATVAFPKSVQVKERISAGAVKTVVATCNGDGAPRKLMMARTGSGTVDDQMTYKYSADGTTFALCAQVKRVMPATLIVGPFVSSMLIGTTNTATFNQWSLSTRARLTYHQTTSGASSHSATVRARDRAATPNVSSFSAAVTGTPIAVAIPAKKWHAGYYMSVHPDSTQATRFGWYDQIGTDTHIKGVSIYLRWGQIEGAQGDYSPGITLIRAEIAKLKSLPVPKRFFFRIRSASYNNNPGTCTGTAATYYPAYIIAMGGCGAITSGTSVAFWDPAVNDRYIAMWKAIGAAFDDEPYFEGAAIISETSIGPYNGNFSYTTVLAQWRRLIAEVMPAFPKSNPVFYVNGVNGQKNADDMIAYMYPLQIAQGAPDTCSQSDCITRMPSINTVMGVAPSTSAPFDYRGKMPIMWSSEATEMGYTFNQHPGGYTVSELYDIVENQYHASHFLWYRNIYVGNNNQRWDTPGGALEFIQTHALSHTGCPTIYTQGCDTN